MANREMKSQHAHRRMDLRTDLPARHAHRRILKQTLCVALALALAFSLAACNRSSQKSDGPTDQTAQDSPYATPGYHAAFAKFIPYSYDETPRVASYTVAADGSNIVNYNQFTSSMSEYYWAVADLSDEATAKLSQNGFVVSDAANWAEYFGVYEDNRYSYAPSFITTDSATHTFHLMFDYILEDVEDRFLVSYLNELSKIMVITSLDQYALLKGTPFENAALRNVAYFSVGAKLADSAFEVPAVVAELVDQEITLVTDASEDFYASPTINFGQDYGDDFTQAEMLDYTQFIPRSHYNRTEGLRAYWRLSKWYGQLTFRSSHEDEVRSALLICNALKQAGAEELWYQIFEPINFFVGECDDLTFYQYQEATASIYGMQGLADLATISDEARFGEALNLISQLEPPQINSIPIYDDELQPDRDAAITGFRFLGERFTIDAAIFQRLMDRSVSERYLPTALDVPSAFGSSEALSILENEGVTKEFPDYAGRMEEARDYFAEVDEATWTSNLYWSWLYMLQPLVDDTSTEGLPFFMQNQAWTRKELNTFEGSWTELKHDTLLYSKQPMAERGGGPVEVPPPDDRGYVEPNPLLFGRLTSLVQMTIDGLDARGMLSDEARDGLTTLHYLSEQLAAISVKELAGETLTDEEYEFIRTYGAELEHIWTTVKAEELETSRADVYLGDHPGAIVADVATGVGEVLEEATGYAQEIYVVFPRDGQQVIGRGVVYSQYEFVVATGQRMTDDQWHAQLTTGNFPALEEWKLAYMADIGQAAQDGWFYPHTVYGSHS